MATIPATAPLVAPAHTNPDLTQIINGVEYISPSPFYPHQKISNNLSSVLTFFVEEQELGDVGVAPMDVILEEGYNSLQPDIYFVSRPRLSIIGDFIHGAPDLVVEIISRSSVKLDRVTKKEIYERNGVQEYWLIHPSDRSVEVFSLNAETGKYELFWNGYLEDDMDEGEMPVVKSKLLQGFEISLARVFRGVS